MDPYSNPVPQLLPPFAFGDRRRRAKHTMAARRRNVSRRFIVKTNSCRHHRRRRQSNWSRVHCDLLELVLRKLPFADTLECRSICSRWRSVAQSHIISSLNSPPPSQLPPLLVWHDPPGFFNALRQEMNLYHLNYKSKQFLDRKLGFCVGFSHGWFLFSDRRKNDCLCLFHPLRFSAVAARFPPITSPKGVSLFLTGQPYRPSNIIKAVLWADPILSNGDYGIALIHPFYKKLLFAKSGATQFTDFEYQDPQRDRNTKWKDVICFQNRIYGIALTAGGEHHMEAWDCTCPDASPIKVLDFQPEFRGIRPSRQSTLHLVESQCELLLVSIKTPDRRNVCHIMRKLMITSPELFDSGVTAESRSPDTVCVYKMDFQQMKWVQMESLGDCVLFIIGNQSLSISTHEFPQYKRNTVYFFTQLKPGPFDRSWIGVFNMEDGSLGEIWPNGHW